MKQEITTSGGTYVVTFTQAGTVEADRNNRTYILATASEAGQVAFKAISDSVIISDDAAILTAEDFVFAPGPILKPTSGGGSSVNDWITVNDAGEAVLNFPEESTNALELFSIGYSRYTKLAGSTAGKISCATMCWGCQELKDVDVEVPNGNTSNMFPNCINLTKAKVIAPVSIAVNSIFQNDTKLQEVYLYAPKAKHKDYMVTNAANIVTFSFNLASLPTISFALDSSSMGNLPKLKNLAILEGGLASCTSFNVSESTLITAESIQNIIDALPDYSGSGTSALVSFPPDRLTEEQQAQLAAKNWTWS